MHYSPQESLEQRLCCLRCDEISQVVTVAARTLKVLCDFKPPDQALTAYNGLACTQKYRSVQYTVAYRAR